jgi:hypothetical protein
MLEQCPQCHNKALPGNFTCAKCGSELHQAGQQIDALTYWGHSGPRQLKYTATILLGVLLSVAFHHVAPVVIGLGAAALLYVKNYK